MKEDVNTEVDRVLTVRWDGKRVEKLDGVGPHRKSDQEPYSVTLSVRTERFGSVPFRTESLSNPRLGYDPRYFVDPSTRFRFGCKYSERTSGFRPDLDATLPAAYSPTNQRTVTTDAKQAFENVLTAPTAILV
jgi:hypothetical protein